MITSWTVPHAKLLKICRGILFSPYVQDCASTVYSTSNFLWILQLSTNTVWADFFCTGNMPQNTVLDKPFGVTDKNNNNKKLKSTYQHFLTKNMFISSRSCKH